MKIVKDRNTIQSLFNQGKPFKSGSILALWIESEEDAILFTAPIKKFKKAVSRNRIKRLMREAWRKNETQLNKSIALVYTSNEILSYDEIEKDIINIINRLK